MFGCFRIFVLLVLLSVTTAKSWYRKAATKQPLIHVLKIPSSFLSLELVAHVFSRLQILTNLRLNKISWLWGISIILTTMWKRLHRTPDREIGNPTLIETTVDMKTLEGSTILNAGEFSISSRPAFGRKKTQDVLKGLPELPLYV